MVSVSHALQILITAKDKTSPAIDKAGSKVKGLIGTIAKAGVKLVALFATIAMAVPGLVATLATIPIALATGLAKLTEYAAELDLVRRAFLGISGEGVPAMLKALKASSAFMVEEIDLLETYNKAYTLLGKNLADKLPEMLGYLTKVAAATGDDVTRLAELTIRSVGRMSTRWMAYVGVMVTVEEAQLRAAEMFDTTTDALTRQQEQAGLLDLTLQRLEARTSAMPEVLGTAAQMVAAFRVESKELYGDLTAFLLPVVRALFPVVMKIVTGFRALISEAGALYRPIRTVTATFVVLIEYLGLLWDKVLEFTTKGSGAITNFADKIISMGWKAFSWGANVIVNFASGMIRSASIVLIGAMNFIGGLLAKWLAPGSPPLIASNIDQWGAGTFTEWLKGFAMADFDVLEGIQAPLKRALDVFVGLGRLAPLEAFYIFQGLTEDLTAAIVEFNQTGIISSGVLERLAQVGGGYGESLAELFRRYAGLAAATKEYAAAQERLKRATEAEDSATKKLSKEAREYNKLVRAGADPATLRAKLAGVKASYASLEAARKEKEEAEEAEDRAKEQLRLQREQVRLQERLLNQLISMAEAMLAAAKGTEDIVELPELEWPEVHPLPIDQAFEDLKERIRKKFEALWDELSKVWEESEAGQWVTRLQERWEAFKTDTLDPMLTKLGEIRDAISTWATEVALPWLLNKWEELRDFWKVEGPKWTQFVIDEWGKWKLWWEEEGPKITGGIDKIGEAWADLGIELPTGFEIWSWVMASIRMIIAWTMGVVRRWLSIIIALLEGDWARAWELFKGGFESTWELIDDLTRGKLGELVVWIGEKWEEIKTAASEKWEEIKLAVVEKLTEIGQSIIDKWEEIKAGAEEKWTDIKTSAEEKWEEVKLTVIGKVEEIFDGLVAKWEELKTNAEEKWEEIKEAIKEKVEALFDWMGLDLDEMLGKWEQIWEDVKLIAITIWKRFKEGVVEKLQEIYDGVMFWVDLVRAYVSTKWELMKAKATKIWDAVKNYVVTNVQAVYDGIVLWIWRAKQWWARTLGEIKTAAILAWSGVLAVVVSKVLDIYNKVKFWIGLLKTWWGIQWAAIKTKAVGLFGETYEGIKTKLGEIYGKIRSVIIEITVWLDGKFAHFREVGERLIRGLGEGVGRMAGWLINRATNIVQDVLNAMKRALGIPGSASQAGESMGEALIRGLADGMDNVAALPAAAMGRIVDGLSGGLEGSRLNSNFAEGARGGRVAAGITIHNHFGKDSIRSDADIYKMTKQMERSLRLRGAGIREPA